MTRLTAHTPAMTAMVAVMSDTAISAVTIPRLACRDLFIHPQSFLRLPVCRILMLFHMVFPVGRTLTY